MANPAFDFTTLPAGSQIRALLMLNVCVFIPEWQLLMIIKRLHSHNIRKRSLVCAFCLCVGGRSDLLVRMGKKGGVIVKIVWRRGRGGRGEGEKGEREGETKEFYP